MARMTVVVLIRIGLKYVWPLLREGLLPSVVNRIIEPSVPELISNKKGSSKKNQSLVRLTFVDTSERHTNWFRTGSGAEKVGQMRDTFEQVQKSVDFVREGRTSMSPRSNEKHTFFEN